MKADIVIVGSGVAGLYCALNLPKEKSIIIVTNRMLADWDNACRDKHTIETLKDRLINDAKIIYLKTK